MSSRFICVHGHFYQPPRENPWLEEIELQESASPFHDWNERITAECYGPNAASRILDHDRRILDIVNNYSKISFNIGPTLLSWLEDHKPDIYEQILEADKISQELFSGHGSALAQVFNHMIMPLANTRDKYTQVIWGLKDFENRFKRLPEGMWLPETAVDLETLDILAENGIRFSILSPFQARAVRQLDHKAWKEVSGGKIDPTMPYKCKLPSGRSISLFFYDGPISQDIAFGGLLESGEGFANRLADAFSQERDRPQLVHVATDGETYGHHHWMGDMALAYCLYYIEQHEIAQLTIYGEYLDNYEPAWEVDIFENSSWSCFHGVQRWTADCGCQSGMHPTWTQAWRKPLRQALDDLRDRLAAQFEKEAGKYLLDPWQTRDNYIKVILDRSSENIENFLAKHSSRQLIHQEKIKVLKLLELQRHATLMYTSCGWFFDEISGIETTQVMRYAARAIQLAQELFDLELEEDFKNHLEKAPSNIKGLKNGRIVYDKFVKPASLDFLFIGSHYALSSLFEEELQNIHIYCYRAENEFYDKLEAGNLKLGIGRTRIVSDVTWDESKLSFAAAYLGEHNANCGIREYMDEQAFENMRQETVEIFNLGDIPELIRVMDKHFQTHNYTLWHLFKDEQQKVLGDILQSSLENIETIFRQILHQHYSFINFLTELQTPVPKTLAVTAETIINTDIGKIFEQEDPDLQALKRLIDEAGRWNINLDYNEIGYKACWKIDELMEHLNDRPDNIALLEQIENILGMVKPLDLYFNPWKAQNIFFLLAKEYLDTKIKEAEAGDENSRSWVNLFTKLAEHLNINIS